MNQRDILAWYKVCASGDLQAAKALIETQSINPNLIIFTSEGEGSGLKFAAESGSLALVKYLHEAHEVDIEARGIHVGTQDTALSRACSKGHLEVAKYLLSKGANPNSVLSYGSVLSEAISSKKIELVQELVRQGAEIDALALYSALEAGVFDLTKFLLEHNTKVLLSQGYIVPFVQTAAKGGCVSTLKLLTEVYNLALLDSRQLMYSAMQGGQVDMVRYLAQEYRLDVKSMIQSDKTMLSNAVKSNSVPLMQYLFEELNLKPSRQTLRGLKQLTARYADITINAYLESFLVQSKHEKLVLLQLATKGLSGLNLTQLQTLYQATLPTKGIGSNFRSELSSQMAKIPRLPTNLMFLSEKKPSNDSPNAGQLPCL